MEPNEVKMDLQLIAESHEKQRPGSTESITKSPKRKASFGTESDIEEEN